MFWKRFAAVGAGAAMRFSATAFGTVAGLPATAVLPWKLPSARADIAAVVVPPYTYLFGGTASDEILRFEPNSGEVRLVGHLPSARAGATAIWTGQEVLVLGGVGPGVPYLDILRFDPTTSQVSLASTMQFWFAYGCAVWDGRTVWIMSGSNPYVFAYDPRSGSLTNYDEPGGPGFRRSYDACVYDGRYIDIFGGDEGVNANGVWREMWRYDPSLRVLRKSDSSLWFAPVYGRIRAAAAFDGRAAFILGGEDTYSYGMPTDTVIHYDTDHDRATLLKMRLPLALKGEATVYQNDRLYVFGGSTGPGLTDDIISLETEVPPPPTNLTARAGRSAGTVSLSWDLPPPDEFSGDILAYRIYAGTALGSENFVGTTGVRSFDVHGLFPSETNSYRVSAVGRGGEGNASSPVFGRAPALPGAPVDLSISVGPGVSTRLTWSPPLDTGSLPITGYAVYRGVGLGLAVYVGATNATPAWVIGSGSVGAEFYRVSAITEAGEGPQSRQVAAGVAASGTISNPELVREAVSADVDFFVDGQEVPAKIGQPRLVDGFAFELAGTRTLDDGLVANLTIMRTSLSKTAPGGHQTVGVRYGNISFAFGSVAVVSSPIVAGIVVQLGSGGTDPIQLLPRADPGCVANDFKVALSVGIPRGGTVVDDLEVGIAAEGSRDRFHHTLGTPIRSDEPSRAWSVALAGLCRRDHVIHAILPDDLSGSLGVFIGASSAELSPLPYEVDVRILDRQTAIDAYGGFRARLFHDSIDAHAAIYLDGTGTIALVNAPANLTVDVREKAYEPEVSACSDGTSLASFLLNFGGARGAGSSISLQLDRNHMVVAGEARGIAHGAVVATNDADDLFVNLAPGPNHGQVDLRVRCANASARVKVLSVNLFSLDFEALNVAMLKSTPAIELAYAGQRGSLASIDVVAMVPLLGILWPTEMRLTFFPHPQLPNFWQTDFESTCGSLTVVMARGMSTALKTGVRCDRYTMRGTVL